VKDLINKFLFGCFFSFFLLKEYHGFQRRLNVVVENLKYIRALDVVMNVSEKNLDVAQYLVPSYRMHFIKVIISSF